MPNVLHIFCRCGHVGTVETLLHEDPWAILPRARCRACGQRGGALDLRLGWMDNHQWQRSKASATPRPLA